MTSERRPSDEQLSAYLDDKLSPTERAEVERVLTTDAEALRTLEELRVVVQLVVQAPEIEPTRDYRQLVRGAPWRERFMTWASAVGSTAAVVLIAVGVIGAVGAGGAMAPTTAPSVVRVVEVEAASVVEPEVAAAAPEAPAELALAAETVVREAE